MSLNLGHDLIQLRVLSENRHLVIILKFRADLLSDGLEQREHFGILLLAQQVDL